MFKVKDGLRLGSNIVLDSEANLQNISSLVINGSTITSNEKAHIHIDAEYPTIQLNDINGDSFYIHTNSNNFYVLSDRDGPGTYGNWDGTYPMQLEADTGIAYLFGSRAFTDAYHPNADKWTTARTITLGGDLTGSVSLDGSSNVTLSAQVVNNSHTHDDRYARAQYLGQANIDDYRADGLYEFDPIPTGTPPIQSPNLRVLMLGNDGRTTQMAFNYATDQAWFRRKHNTTWHSWREFIHSGNIGSQSVNYANSAGNSTLLSGAPGSYYWSKSTIDCDRNIGTNTNLDIDLANGGVFKSYGNANTYWNAPFSYGGVIGYKFSANSILAQVGFDIRHNTSDYGNLMFRTHNNLGWNNWVRVWHNYNDGSGSGLDADLLDGIHAGSFWRRDSDNTGYAVRFGQAELDFAAGSHTTIPPMSMRLWDNYVQSGAPSSYGTVLDIYGRSGHAHNQLYFEGNTNNLRMRRGWYGNNNWSGWANFWNSENDGSGSGLDADLLDGQHASAFASSSHNHSLTLNGDVSGSGSVSGTISVSVNNDSHYHSQVYIPDTRGAARAPSYYPDRYTSFDFQNTSDTGAGGDSWHVLQTVSPWSSYNNAHRQQQLAFTGTGGIKFRYATSDSAWAGWQTIWTSGNDGSGSGLDADLLDGNHASAFAPASHSHNYLSSDSDSEQTGHFGLIYWNQSASRVNSDPRINESGYDSDSTNIHWWTTTAAGANYGRVGHALYNGSAYQYLHTKASQNNLYINNNVIWHGGNDGSGSGLDADLLDGIDSSRIVYGGNASKINSHSNANSQVNSGFYENGGGGSNWPSGTWYNSINVRHSNQGNYHGFQLAMSYYDNHLWARSYQGSGTFQGWAKQWSTYNDGSGSGLDADLLDGYHAGENGGNKVLKLASNGYSQIQNWTNVANSGIYSTTANSAHFYPNTASSYGTWRIDGSRGGYTGILFSYSGGGNNNGVHLMFDGSRNGGLWNTAWSGDWAYYYHASDRCLGVGGSTTSSSYGLYEQGGGIYSTGNITAYSDVRVKENIQTIDNALETVTSMRGVTYNRIDDPEKKTVIGFIAQEVEAIEKAKPLVTYAEDIDQYGVSYGNVTALLVEAIKELKEEIGKLKQEIEELKNE